MGRNSSNYSNHYAFRRSLFGRWFKRKLRPAQAPQDPTWGWNSVVAAAAPPGHRWSFCLCLTDPNEIENMLKSRGQSATCGSLPSFKLPAFPFSNVERLLKFGNTVTLVVQMGPSKNFGARRRPRQALDRCKVNHLRVCSCPSCAWTSLGWRLLAGQHFSTRRLSLLLASLLLARPDLHAARETRRGCDQTADTSYSNSLIHTLCRLSGSGTEGLEETARHPERASAPGS